MQKTNSKKAIFKKQSQPKPGLVYEIIRPSLFDNETPGVVNYLIKNAL